MALAATPYLRSATRRAVSLKAVGDSSPARLDFTDQPHQISTRGTRFFFV